MGGAQSTITERMTEVASQTQSAACTTQQLCQNASTGPLVIKNTILDCPTINIATNHNTSSFSCSINQSASTIASLMNQNSNIASASWGDYSSADDNVNIAVQATNKLTAKCGGANGSTSAAASGACRSGIVQRADVASLTLTNDKVGCTTMNVATNTNNNNMLCSMKQVGTLDANVTNAVKNSAVSTDEFVLFFIIALSVMLGLIILPALGAAVSSVLRSTGSGVGDFWRAILPHKTKGQRRLADLSTEVDIEQKQIELAAMRKAAAQAQAAGL